MDNKAIELTDITNNALNRISDLPKNILQEVLIKIMDSGLNIGRWVMDDDINGDFRI